MLSINNHQGVKSETVIWTGSLKNSMVILHHNLQPFINIALASVKNITVALVSEAACISIMCKTCMAADASCYLLLITR